MLSAAILLVLLVVAVVVANLLLKWPPDALLGWVLLAALLVGLLPLILLVLNRLAADGGSVKIPGVLELAFQAARTGPGAVEVAHISGNLGAPPGVAVQDSGGGNIMAALTQAVSNPIAVVDLGDGDAWWESRLLVLLSGATRLARPRVIVFVATRHRQPNQLLGWGEPPELLRRMLASADSALVTAYHAGRARGMQWQIGELQVGGLAATPPWASAAQVWPNNSGHELAVEALLMQKLATVESGVGGVRSISIGRLEDLVGPVLHMNTVEDSAPEQEKLAAVLATTDSYLAVTKNGQYSTVIPRDVAVNAVLSSIVQPREAAARSAPNREQAPPST